MAANRIIAYCGLDCAECPAYIATRAGDEARLAETATEWSSDDYPVSAAEVPCDGCVQQGGAPLQVVPRLRDPGVLYREGLCELCVL